MNRKEKYNYLKDNNGIILVALVVTIIVLIILAGISINLILGDNGIITKAKEASKAQEIAEIKENVQMKIAELEMQKLQNGQVITQAEIETILQSQNLEVIKNDDETIKSIKPVGKDYEIPYEEIYRGQVSQNTPVVPETPIVPEVLPIDGSYNATKGVNTPKINEAQGMKLVTFNTNTKTWVEDTTNSDYEYIAGEGTSDNTSSRWANAIVTKDGIDSYFVWIPRYAYKIDSTNKTIDVKFIQGTGTTAADGTVCKYADDSTLTADDYIVHPAFTSNANLGGGFGELSGLWIGKYESSRSDADATNIGESTSLKVVPSVKSWTNTTIGEMYTYAKAYNTELKSHMLKNSEWGAVAYLTYSKYGRNGNEIAINQCSDYITGAGPGTGTSNIYNNTYAYDVANFETTYSFTSSQGKKASTTGNEYGIYDISGGTQEYVASYYNGTTSLSNGSIFAKRSGTSNEYATVYTGETASSNYIKGDATYETSGWNSDVGRFVNSYGPFFGRGHDDGSGTGGAGPFSSVNYAGAGNAKNSFRISLAIM